MVQKCEQQLAHQKKLSSDLASQMDEASKAIKVLGQRIEKAVAFRTLEDLLQEKDHAEAATSKDVPVSSLSQSANRDDGHVFLGIKTVPQIVGIVSDYPAEQDVAVDMTSKITEAKAAAPPSSEKVTDTITETEAVEVEAAIAAEEEFM